MDLITGTAMETQSLPLTLLVFQAPTMNTGYFLALFQALRNFMLR
jgi:hypothetical protein